MSSLLQRVRVRFSFWVFMNYICSQGGVQGGQVVALLCFSGIHVLFGGSRQGSVPLRVKIINNFDQII